MAGFRYKRVFDEGPGKAASGFVGQPDAPKGWYWIDELAPDPTWHGVFATRDAAIADVKNLYPDCVL